MGIECTCLYDADMATYPEFHRITYPKARKTHICGECGDAINPGETYEYVAGKWDGQLGTFKTCRICQRIRDDFCCSFYYGELREAIWEVLGLDYITGETDDEG